MEAKTATFVFPPCAGLSELGYRIIPPSDVFPPHAGVIGGVLDSHNHRRGIPPACGGYRLISGIFFLI